MSKDKTKNPKETGTYKIVRVQPTPNPDAFQFMLNGKVIGDGTKTFDSPEDGGSEVLAKALELISDKSLYKLTFKNASFLCESDEDSMTQHYMMDLFSGEQTKIQVNDMEEKALQQIGSHFGFDEDQLLGLRTRLENGELGSIYSAD